MRRVPRLSHIAWPGCAGGVSRSLARGVQVLCCMLKVDGARAARHGGAVSAPPRSRALLRYPRSHLQYFEYKGCQDNFTIRNLNFCLFHVLYGYHHVQLSSRLLIKTTTICPWHSHAGIMSFLCQLGIESGRGSSRILQAVCCCTC